MNYPDNEGNFNFFLFCRQFTPQNLNTMFVVITNLPNSSFFSSSLRFSHIFCYLVFIHTLYPPFFVLIFRYVLCGLHVIPAGKKFSFDFVWNVFLQERVNKNEHNNFFDLKLLKTKLEASGQVQYFTSTT